MEINYKSEISTYLNNLYNITATNCQMFSNNGFHNEAIHEAGNAMHQAYGAIYFVVGMLNENGYSATAGEILSAWNNEWEKNFSGLIYDYR